MESRKKHFSIVSFVLCTILVLYAIILLSVLYWGVITSLKSIEDFADHNNNFLGFPKSDAGSLLAPWQWEFGNFAKVVQFFDMKVTRNGVPTIITVPIQLLYTVLFAIGCAFVGTLCPCIVAYATRKFNYGFNKVIDLLVIICMTVPIIGAQASMLELLNRLNIYDTFLGLYAQKFYFGNMYYFVFSAVFKGISKEYYEASSIDGASEWQMMVKIAFPLVLTSFGLVFLLYFIAYWNDYHTLLVYAPSHPTLAYSLFHVMTVSTGSGPLGQMPVRMAGCTMIAVPVVILFIIFRNKLMGNLTIGGVKE